MSRLLTAAALIAATGLAAGAARAQGPRISVAPVAGEHASPEIREQIAQSLAAGLIASGAEVAPALSEATYMLRGTVSVEGRSYTLHLEMIDRRTGAIVASREDRCEICTEAEAFETANTAASTLKAIVFKRQPGAAPGTAAVPAEASTAPAPVALAPTPNAQATGVGGPTPPAGAQLETTAASPARHTTLGWVGVAAGVASAGAGAILIGIDGNGTCSDSAGGACPNQYNTRSGGIVLVGLGAVAVAAGVLALLGKL